MKNVIKYIGIVLKLGYFIAVIFFMFMFLSGNSSFVNVAIRVLFWLIFLGWIGIVVEKCIKSSSTLQFSFILFIIGVVALYIDMSFAETVMRISFVGWIIGLAQSLKEFKEQK